MNKCFLCGVSIVLAAGLVLGGCGKKPAKQNTGQGGSGGVEVQAQSDGSSVPLPSNMPSYAAIYPGGSVKAVIVSHNTNDPTIIAYSTTASLDEVIAFHKKKCEDASLAAAQDIAIANGRMFSAQSSDGAKVLVVTAAASEGELTVQVSYK